MIHPLPEGAVSLRPVAAGDEPPASLLTVQGRTARRPIAGIVLEAAFDCSGRCLVFTTDDIPFEDALHVHLLDANLELLDTATLGAMYSTGSFELIGAALPCSVHFRFFGDTDWTVELLDAAALRLPLISEPRGVHRRLGFTRHFKVHGKPQAERAA